MSLSDTPSFHSQVKQILLEYYKKNFYEYLKPQMGGFIDENSISLSILGSEIESANHLNLKCGVFYIEKIGGCNCLDEPYEENGYCEVQLRWDIKGIHIF